MSELTSHARRELELAGLFDKDSDYNGNIGKAVMELIEVFAKQSHSGFSAAMTVDIFRRVAMFQVLLPLTGKDEEWNEVGTDEYQNNRDSAVFKHSKDGKPYYLDAIVWRRQDGISYTGTVDGIQSWQYIKNFPFVPKTFYIDVVKTECLDGTFVMKIKNKEQLKQVAEYYDAPKIEEMLKKQEVK
jgi:hypothetical protein